MSNLMKLKNKPNFVAFPNGASDQEILDAESLLSLKFSSDFKEYTKEFGAVSFEGHELTGVVKSKRLNVVENTLAKRKTNNKFPLNYYVIENLGIDGLSILQDENGYVYLYSNENSIKKFASSLEEYFNDLE